MRRLGMWMSLSWGGSVWAQEAATEEVPTEESEVEEAESAAAEEAPAEVEAEVVAPELSVIRIGGDGRVQIQGQVVSKRKLGDAINVRLMESPEASWQLELEPGADDKLTATAVGALFAVGIRDFSTVEVVPPQPEVPEGGPEHPVVVGGPVALMGVATATGEVRFGLAIDRLDALEGDDDHLEPGLAFELAEVELGLDLDLNEAISGRATMSIQGESGFETISIDTAGGDSASFEHANSANGYQAEAEAVYLDLRPLQDDRLSLRTGIQQSVFGSAGMMDDADGYYTMGAHHQSLPVLAGLVDLYDAGLTLRSEVREGRGSIAIQAMNSAEDAASGEQDVDKAITGRVGWQILDPLQISVSGLQEKPGDDADSSVGAASILLNYGSDSTGVMAEFLWGSWDVAGDGGTPDKHIGGQLAARTDLALGEGPVETLRVVARGAYFDPRSETKDADAWMQLNLSLQGLWASPDETLVITGLGYEVEMPMDATAAIEHRALIQAVTRF